jgi:hypothetical protein
MLGHRLETGNMVEEARSLHRTGIATISLDSDELRVGEPSTRAGYLSTLLAEEICEKERNFLARE